MPATLGCILLALALAACSSVKSQVDAGPISARTFSFLSTGQRQLPGYAEDRKQAHALIHQAIVNNLAAKGGSSFSAGAPKPRSSAICPWKTAPRASNPLWTRRSRTCAYHSSLQGISV